MKILCCPYGGRSDGPSLRFAGVFGGGAQRKPHKTDLPDRKRAQKMLDGTGKCALYCQRKGNEGLPWRKPEPLVRQIMS